MERIQLSKNFYLDEFTRSQTAERHGIDMDVPVGSPVFVSLERLCYTILQPVRDALGPVNISSGYRPLELNKLIGGSLTSQHRFGEAADFTVVGHTPLEVCNWIADNLPLVYHQLIHEFGRWVHASIVLGGRGPRRQQLTAYKRPGEKKTLYADGLHEIESLLRTA